MNNLPIDRLPDVKLKQMRNYPNQKLIKKFKVDYNGTKVDAEVWTEDPVNYHYFFIDEENKLIRFGLLKKTESPVFQDLWNEYKLRNNYY